MISINVREMDSRQFYEISPTMMAVRFIDDPSKNELYVGEFFDDPHEVAAALQQCVGNLTIHDLVISRTFSCETYVNGINGVTSNIWRKNRVIEEDGGWGKSFRIENARHFKNDGDAFLYMVENDFWRGEP